MKLRKQYICEMCNHVHPKRWGWCQQCGARDSLHEDVIDASVAVEVRDAIAEDVERISSGISELDLVCGGGMLPGSTILIGGEPGIGKSTLLTQLCSALGDSVVYFSGEESVSQIQSRMSRLNATGFKVVSTGKLPEILAICKKHRPQLIVIDSIQTVRDDSECGSAEQIRLIAAQLISYAKNNSCVTVIVGHVTKLGTLAGPKLLEHMVDVVLNFEGNDETRVLRSAKNRFGSTQEVGLFTMTSCGLQSIADPSTHLCSFRKTPTIGSVIFPSIEGSKPMLIEIQALVAQSYLQLPRRSVVGWCHNRLAMIIAVVENHLRINFGHKDIYLSVAGGMRIADTATADLAVAAAILSAVKQLPVPIHLSAFGEIALSGEVRPASHFQRRVALCDKHKLAVLHNGNLSTVSEILSALKTNFP